MLVRMKIFLLVVFVSLAFASVAEARGRVRYKIPSGAVEKGAYPGLTGDLIDLPPPSTWRRTSRLNALYRMDKPFRVGASALTRPVLVGASRFVPYVGLGVLAYMEYQDIKNRIDEAPGQYPNIEQAFRDAAGASCTGPNQVETYPDNFVQGYLACTGKEKVLTGTQCGNYSRTVGYWYNTTSTFGEYTKSVGCNGQPSYKLVEKYNFVDGVEVPGAIDAQIAEILNGAASGDADLAPQYGNELDEMFKNGDAEIDYSTYNVMADYAQDALDSYTNDKKLSTVNANDQAAADADAAADEADDVVNRRVAVYNQAAADAAANPNDAALKAAADAALAALEEARNQANLLRAIADALAAEKARWDSEQAEEESLVAPEAPENNTFDTDISLPDSKSISDLLLSWVSSSPLAGMVQSFTINTVSPVSSVSCGTFYGQEIKLDFARYNDTFTTCGGVLLVIAHGFAVLVVIRGW